MDTKVTLHFNQEVINKAKAFAAKNNISLSRLTEFIYDKITSGNYKNLEELPISDWVLQVSEGEAEYKRRSRKDTRNEYLQSKK
ncbi:hypothetical protein FNH22_04155 [Fulvivirga sp. M361]|uniref:DUF6364 family protein n=1 Tax=Fulvivirga sp. M361 TaxID=2594266 RepID=UPI00117A1308|nr:DUF6364 family protein [Fulvivirga sp. M361]TRX61256.1 hypothetical protein FNH22_04155 [Fulvivirga sp. M361]